jgi:hypothetical protein
MTWEPSYQQLIVLHYTTYVSVRRSWAVNMLPVQDSAGTSDTYLQEPVSQRIYVYIYYYLLQLGFHLVAVVLH